MFSKTFSILSGHHQMFSSGNFTAIGAVVGAIPGEGVEEVPTALSILNGADLRTSLTPSTPSISAIISVSLFSKDTMRLSRSVSKSCFSLLSTAPMRVYLVE